MVKTHYDPFDREQYVKYSGLLTDSGVLFGLGALGLHLAMSTAAESLIHGGMLGAGSGVLLGTAWHFFKRARRYREHVERLNRGTNMAANAFLATFATVLLKTLQEAAPEEK